MAKGRGASSAPKRINQAGPKGTRHPPPSRTRRVQPRGPGKTTTATRMPSITLDVHEILGTLTYKGTSLPVDAEGNPNRGKFDLLPTLWTDNVIGTMSRAFTSFQWTDITIEYRSGASTQMSGFFYVGLTLNEDIRYEPNVAIATPGGFSVGISSSTRSHVSGGHLNVLQLYPLHPQSGDKLMYPVVYWMASAGGTDFTMGELVLHGHIRFVNPAISPAQLFQYQGALTDIVANAGTGALIPLSVTVQKASEPAVTAYQAALMASNPVTGGFFKKLLKIGKTFLCKLDPSGGLKMVADGIETLVTSKAVTEARAALVAAGADEDDVVADVVAVQPSSGDTPAVVSYTGFTLAFTVKDFGNPNPTFQYTCSRADITAQPVFSHVNEIAAQLVPEGTHTYSSPGFLFANGQLWLPSGSANTPAAWAGKAYVFSVPATYAASLEVVYAYQNDSSNVATYIPTFLRYTDSYATWFRPSKDVTKQTLAAMWTHVFDYGMSTASLIIPDTFWDLDFDPGLTTVVDSSESFVAEDHNAPSFRQISDPKTLVPNGTLVLKARQVDPADVHQCTVIAPDGQIYWIEGDLPDVPGLEELAGGPYVLYYRALPDGSPAASDADEGSWVKFKYSSADSKSLTPFQLSANYVALPLGEPGEVSSFLPSDAYRAVSGSLYTPGNIVYNVRDAAQKWGVPASYFVVTRSGSSSSSSAPLSAAGASSARPGSVPRRRLLLGA